MTPEELEALAATPANATVDGRSASSRSADDVLKLLDRAKAEEAAEGTNDNGGPISPWRCLRMARASMPGAR